MCNPLMKLSKQGLEEFIDPLVHKIEAAHTLNSIRISPQIIVETRILNLNRRKLSFATRQF